ncbi:MAG: MFS transporter, partial [Phycisphaerales bacterium]|nr:MFS transporter [Phycisphaerales bacterium]
FLWTAATHGRDKVRTINLLQAATIILVGLIALVPVTGNGLFLMAGLFAAARVCFSGVLTLRATVWRHNYSRFDRARATAKLQTIVALIIAGTGYAVGRIMDGYGPQAFRAVVPTACVAGAVGVFVYGRIRLRGHAKLLRDERGDAARERPSVNPASMLRLLRADPFYARFQLSMFLLGAGNLMVAAPLAIILKDRLGSGYAGGIGVLSTIPMLVLPFTVPLWAHLLARTHVVRFRALHSWVFVVGQSLVLAGALLNSMALLGVAMAIQGFGYAGGSLAWNIGHLDFAPQNKAAQYMAIHVTLNGVRGILAPLLAVQVYVWLNGWHPGTGAWVFGLSAVVCALGGLGFMSLQRSMGDLARRTPRES